MKIVEHPYKGRCVQIFVSHITLRNGRKLYASQCGKKAFPLLIPIDKWENQKSKN